MKNPKNRIRELKRTAVRPVASKIKLKRISGLILRKLNELSRINSEIRRAGIELTEIKLEACAYDNELHALKKEREEFDGRQAAFDNQLKGEQAKWEATPVEAEESTRLLVNTRRQIKEINSGQATVVMVMINPITLDKMVRTRTDRICDLLYNTEIKEEQAIMLGHAVIVWQRNSSVTTLAT